MSFSELFHLISPSVIPLRSSPVVANGRISSVVMAVLIYLYRRRRVCVCTCAQACPTLATPSTIACQAPLSMEFSREENWSGLPCPPPGDLPDPGIEPASLGSPALAGRYFTSWATREDVDIDIDTDKRHNFLIYSSISGHLVFPCLGDCK